ncbi:glutathione S-transferase family protein [Roseateles sp. DC23W]|uniref:glutathione transferase n=1 Tax=Pelomonas dachongensis TaxID=3299029 RepID=A0ABW7EV35_9BURK
MPLPTLTLVSHPLCPFVQRAAIVLLEKQVPFERIDVDLSHKPDWFLAMSPTGKVPLLQVDAGHGAQDVLFESMAICEYLQETLPGASHYPDDPLARARQRAWVEFGSAALGDAWGFLNAKDAVTGQQKAAAFQDKLAQIDKVLGSGPYFAGDAFGMVDAVFAPVFRYFDVLDAAISAPLFAGVPRVQAWRRQLGARASVAAAVSADYPALSRAHLQRQKSWLAQPMDA